MYTNFSNISGLSKVHSGLIQQELGKETEKHLIKKHVEQFLGSLSNMELLFFKEVITEIQNSNFLKEKVDFHLDVKWLGGEQFSLSVNRLASEKPKSKSPVSNSNLVSSESNENNENKKRKSDDTVNEQEEPPKSLKTDHSASLVIDKVTINVPEPMADVSGVSKPIDAVSPKKRAWEEIVLNTNTSPVPDTTFALPENSETPDVKSAPTPTDELRDNSKIDTNVDGKVSDESVHDASSVVSFSSTPSESSVFEAVPQQSNNTITIITTLQQQSEILQVSQTLLGLPVTLDAEISQMDVSTEPKQTEEIKKVEENKSITKEPEMKEPTKEADMKEPTKEEADIKEPTKEPEMKETTKETDMQEPTKEPEMKETTEIVSIDTAASSDTKNIKDSKPKNEDSESETVDIENEEPDDDQKLICESCTYPFHHSNEKLKKMTPEQKVLCSTCILEFTEDMMEDAQREELTQDFQKQEDDETFE